VYGLFHHLARTPQGKQLLRQYFLRPSTDSAVINERLDTAAVFLRPDNHGPLMNITKNLGQVKNMRAVMINLKKGVSSGLSKGGGIKNGIWSTLRSVRKFICRFIAVQSDCMTVCIPHNADPGRNDRTRRRR